MSDRSSKIRSFFGHLLKNSGRTTALKRR